jgi:hypothetical protein
MNRLRIGFLRLVYRLVGLRLRPVEIYRTVSEDVFSETQSYSLHKKGPRLLGPVPLLWAYLRLLILLLLLLIPHYHWTA